MGERARPLHGTALDLGRLGEQAALSEYAARGFHAVATNWRCPLGEIDVIVSRGSLLVFCEVKTRRGRGMGGPFEAVTATKQRRLRALAVAFLASPQARAGWPPADVRFDVASVTLDARGRPQVHVFEDAF